MIESGTILLILQHITNKDMDSDTIFLINRIAWVVSIFTLGVLTGYLLKIVQVNRERIKNQREIDTINNNK